MAVLRLPVPGQSGPGFTRHLAERGKQEGEGDLAVKGANLAIYQFVKLIKLR